MNKELKRAIEVAKQHLPIQAYTTKPEYCTGMTVVQKDNGRYAVYDADAWGEPSEKPMLPWSPPTGTKVLHISQDETITYF